MCRRKLLILLTLFLIAGASGPFFWETNNDPETRRKLEAFRAMIQSLAAIQSDPAVSEKLTDKELQLELRVLKVYLTDSRAFVFAEKSDNKLYAGLFKQGDPDAAWKALDGVSDLTSRPQLKTRSGQQALLNLGSTVTLMGSTISPIAFWHEFSELIEMTPFLRERSEVILDLHIAVNKVIPTSHSSGEPTYESFRDDKTRVRIHLGDTLLVGGLKVPVSHINTSRIPYLSEIPVVGSVFTKRSERVIEEELLIVVKPQLIGN
jgi:Flp pilus assembly secretin CpaC